MIIEIHIDTKRIYIKGPIDGYYLCDIIDAVTAEDPEWIIVPEVLFSVN